MFRKIEERELNTEKNFWIFMGISAGIHIVFLFSLIEYSLPPTSAQFLEVELIEIGEPNKPPGPVEKSLLEEELQPSVLPVIEKEEIIQSAFREILPTTQDLQTVSSPVHSAVQQAESSGGGGINKILLAYLSIIRQKIEEAKKYPPDALEKGEEGKTYLKFKILPDGNVKDIAVIKSSGFSILDEFSVRLVESVAPFPPPPGSNPLSIKSIAINYKINP